MADAAPDRRVRHPRVAALYRLQWEPAQDAHVLLFPEGMVKLNRSAGEILARCDGTRTVDAIVATGLAGDVDAFLTLAAERRWIDWSTP